jgi:hypothetical protein
VTSTTHHCGRVINNFSRDKNFWKIFERTKCGPEGEGQEARNNNAKDANGVLYKKLFALLALFAAKNSNL